MPPAGPLHLTETVAALHQTREADFPIPEQEDLQRDRAVLQDQQEASHLQVVIPPVIRSHPQAAPVQEVVASAVAAAAAAHVQAAAAAAVAVAVVVAVTQAAVAEEAEGNSSYHPLL